MPVITRTRKGNKKALRTIGDIKWYKNWKIWLAVIIIVIIIVVTVVLIVMLTNKSSTSSIKSTTTSSPAPTKPIPSPTTTTTKPIPTVPIPVDCKSVVFPGIKGTWSSQIACGNGDFDIISLGSALPQDYSTTGLDTFFSHIEGNFDSNLSGGRSKYLISVGGSNASSSGWTSFLSALTTSSQNLSNFINGLTCRGIVGLDLDLEGIDANAHKPMILTLIQQIKQLNSNFKIMLTILLGQPQTFDVLIPSPHYDYLSLMLYNGGMYHANTSGAGCDWDQWAELFLSRGTAGCETPIKVSRSTYSQMANLSSVQPSKVLLGLITDSSENPLDANMIARAFSLIKQYGGGGTMLWLIPGGWGNSKNMELVNSLCYNVDISKCNSGSTCPPPPEPCLSGMTKQCIASQCGIKAQGVTDADCTPCGSGQSYWPCGALNFCQAKPDITPSKCF